MTRRRRWVATLAALLCLVIAFGAGWWWVFNTEPGATWGFARLGVFFPGRLDVSGMRGPLRSPFEIRKFAYKSDSLSITADRVFIRWHLKELIRRRLDIDQLHADNVSVIWGAPGNTPQARDSVSGPLPDLNLPVSVVIREGILNRLGITRTGADSSAVIDRIELSARSVRRDSLHVDHLSVRSRWLDVEFAGVAVPRGAYPLALHGSWIYRSERFAPVQGTGTIAGTLDSLRAVQKLSGPFDADLNLSLFRPLRTHPSLQGEVHFAGLAPRDLDPSLPEGVFRGHVLVSGDRAELIGQGDVHGPVGALGPVDAAFRVRHAGTTLLVEQAVVTRPGRKERFSARGTIADDRRFDLQTEWTGAGWPLQGEPLLESERGRARLQGTSRDFDIHLEALLAGRNIPPGTWHLDGRGSPGHLAIRTVVADILGGRITGTGSVGWQPRPRWNLTFHGESINPGVAFPAYPGVLAFAGQTQGVQETGGSSGRILVSHLEGTLRSQPLSGAGTLTASHGQYALRQAYVQWGPNRTDATGEFGQRWSLDWKLDAPQLGAALAKASGSLRGTGSIRGATGRQRFTGTLAGDSLFAGNVHATTLRATGDVDLAPGGLVKLDASATQIDDGMHAADRATLTASGTRDRNQIRASLAYRGDSAVAVLAGGMRDGTWSGVLNTLDLVNTRAGRWALAGPAKLTASRSHAALAGFVWQSGTSRATLDADWERNGPWHLDSRLDRVPLALVAPELPPRLKLDGFAAGHITAHATTDGHLYADVDVVPGPGTISYNAASGQWVPTTFQNARVHGAADGSRVNVGFGADLVGAGTVRGTMAWPAFGAPSEAFRQPVHGKVAVHMTNLALAQGFTPELDATSGALDADLGIAGTLADPTIYGPLTLKNGSADVPRYGLQLREMNVEGRGTPEGCIALDGSVRSGTGTLKIHGTAAMARGGKPVADVAITGQRVQAMNSKDMQFLASPDVHFKLDGRRADVTGQVEIPEGKIDIGEEYENRRAVKPSPDVVYAGADTSRPGAYELYTNVKVVLGTKVSVVGFGMNAAPTGTVEVIDTPGLPTLGRGQLEIKDGKYQIYGQTLNIDTGSLIFAGGPITNPAVRARASRTADDGTVAGFNVSGTLMQPDVQVFSDPAMGQSEALSYVMFGKPIESANLSQGQMASTMATTLGVPGTNMLAHGIASGLGIEEARVEVGNTFQNTSLMLGTHLTPKLYVSAGMDVFQSTSSLRLRYILNKIFTLEAETAHQNRVDLLYTVER